MGQFLWSTSQYNYEFEDELADFDSNDRIYDHNEGHERIYKSTNITPLMYLVKRSRQLNMDDQLKQYILNNKDQLNKQDLYGDTALIIACKTSNTTCSEEVIKMLIEADADLNLTDQNGNTALMFASLYSNSTSTENTVKMLVDAGADLNLQNYGGHMTALMFASYYSRSTSTENTVKILINAGANLNLTDMHYSTALIKSCAFCNTTSSENTVKMLIDAGTNIEYIDYSYCNNSALKLICERGSSNITKYLLDHSNHTEKQLLDCIKRGYQSQLLQEYLKKFYYKKISYNPYVENCFMVL